MGTVRIASFVAIAVGVGLIFWGRELNRPIFDPDPKEVQFALPGPGGAVLTGVGVLLAVVGFWMSVRSSGVLESPGAVRATGVTSVVIGGLMLLCGAAAGVALAGEVAKAGARNGTALLAMALPAGVSVLVGGALVLSGVLKTRYAAAPGEPAPGRSDRRGRRDRGSD